MPSGRYAPVPTSQDEEEARRTDELEAAFEEDDENDQESAPLVRPVQTTAAPPPPLPGTYDFERIDYADYPPPGSPTRMEGNSNGVLPGPVAQPAPQRGFGGWRNLLSWTRKPAEPTVGGGLQQDGVFSNIMAHPGDRRTTRNDGGNEDNIYMSPEEQQRQGPPSYLAAQMDAVPPYWETTIHAPASGAQSAPGDLVIEGQPTGTLFVFCWSMLLTVSFQFVGFMLTYLLHTSHAGKFGARAGLGIVLIQYGFTLRAERGEGSTSIGGEGWTGAESITDPLNPSTPSPSATLPDDDTLAAGARMSDTTADWVSFLLMTVGWLILLSSCLGWARVKRWERSIIAASNPEQPNSEETGPPTLLGRITFAYNSAYEASFGRLRREAERPLMSGQDISRELEQGTLQEPNAHELAMLSRTLPPGLSPEERQQRLIQMWATDQRLQRDLANAGLI